MNSIQNIYCDESCHLEHDASNVMVIGAITCPKNHAKRIADEIKKLKEKHNIPQKFEIKWNKISSGKKDFYLDIIRFFFDEKTLAFRGLVAHKSNLNHPRYNQTHNEWYFKMLYYLLNPLFSPTEETHIYLDKKDTQSAQKAKKLHDIICCANHDFDKKLISRIQNVESHHVIQIQLADLLSGALAYANRSLNSSPSKNEIIAFLREKTGYQLLRSTLMNERKFNICVWKGRDER